MDYLKKYQSRLQSQIAKIEDLVDQAVYDNEGNIVEHVRERWLKGEKPDGSAIGVYKSKAYAEEKNLQNPEAGFGFVDLTLTHGLEKGLKISKYGEDYEIYSRDPKYVSIAKKYGDENFNLTPAETTELKETVEAEVLGEILNKTYKK